MKNPKLFFSLLFICIIISFINSKSFSQTGWVLRSTGTNINSVFFTDPSHGWMVGDSGLAFASYDGGTSWFGMESKTTNNLNSVFFKDAYTGWVAGSNGTIIKTIDGGDNWILLTSGTTENFETINFPTLDTGFVSSYGGGHTFKTTDGGSSWFIFGGGWNNIFFLNGLNGIATYPLHSVGRTTDGGASWLVYAGSAPNGYGIYFSSVNTGWVSGTGGHVYKTTNNGLNWVTQSTGIGIFSTLFGINFSSSTDGWSVGSAGTIGANSEITRTTNGGTNWVSQYSGTTNILKSVSALSSTSGVTVGDAGTVLLTTNGGTNWDNRLNVFSFPSAPYYNLYSTFFINDNTGWSGGFSGVINKTINGGDSWTSVNTASFNSINSIHFLDTDTGWVAGNSGMIQLTKNGGENWTINSIATSSNINDINIGKFPLTGFSGLYKIGWCVGNSGLIYKTVDGGENWTGQMSPSTANLYSVVPFSENIAIACGDSGMILKTTNGGTTWTITVSGVVDGALRSLSFADENNGICVGDSATVLYTTNKGDTWSLDITGPRALTKKNLYDVSARMELMVTYTAIGEEGIVIKSEDEGGSWTKLSSGVKTRLYGISSPAENISYIVGTRGTIIKTEDGGALPVELISFSFSQTDNNVILNWATSAEINNSGFDVERLVTNSQGETGPWSKINFVKGHGNTNSQQFYSYEDRYLSPGKYNYRIKQIDYNGNYEYYNLLSEVFIGTPDKFNLMQNYPNPFNPNTIISFDLPVTNYISLKVYNALGREVKTLVNEKKDAGHYKIEFEGSNYSSGVYFYTLTAGDIKQTKKMLLLK